MANISRKRSAQLTLLFIFEFVIFLCFCFLILIFNSTFKETRETINIRSRRRLNNTMMESPTENELPLCVGNLLDKRHYRYGQEKNGGSHYDSNRLMTHSGSCRLLNYTTERIVTCLDALRNQQPNDTQLRLIFMGDSIIRQHYLNFVRLLPDYDKILRPSNAALLFQGDMEVTSVILGLRLSFRWQPFVSDNVVEMARQWQKTNLIRRPHLLLLSMAAWHMFDAKHRDQRRYEKKVEELAPTLAQLSNVTRVIWLNQYPAVEFYGDNNAPNTHVTSKKIYNYNKAVRRILLGLLQNQKSNSNVQIWDSGNPQVEEYVRSCHLFRRYEKKKTSPGLLALKYYSGAYRNCRSDIHAGYSVLSLNTQLFLNDICSETFSAT